MDYIKRYSYKPDPIFWKTDAEDDSTKCYLGVELEIDADSWSAYRQERCSEELNTNDPECELYYQKHDGSLRSGIEVVSQPCTLDFHCNVFPWKTICDIALNNGYQENAQTCGLHVHVSKAAFGNDTIERDLNIAKVLILVRAFWNEIRKFSRRNVKSLNAWARQHPTKIFADDNVQNIFNKERKVSSTRYTAVNIRNRDTVEFRVFKGTLDPKIVKATLQFVQNIVDYACSTELKDLQKTNWYDIIHYRNYPELNEYLDSIKLNVRKKCTKANNPLIWVMEIKEGVPLYVNNAINTEAYELKQYSYSDYESKFLYGMNHSLIVATLEGRKNKVVTGFDKIRYATNAGNVKLRCKPRAVSPNNIAMILLPQSCEQYHELDLSNSYCMKNGKYCRPGCFHDITGIRRSIFLQDAFLMGAIRIVSCPNDVEIKQIKVGDVVSSYGTLYTVRSIGYCLYLRELNGEESTIRYFSQIGSSCLMPVDKSELKAS